MFRIAFLICICSGILMGMGIVPKPTAEDLPDFSMPEISMPEQPAILADIGDLVLELPEMGKRVKDRVVNAMPKPTFVAPQVIEVVETAAVVEPAIAVHMVNFELDKAELDRQAQGRLSDVIVWLSANPMAEVRIFGHTDLTGSAAYNNELGQNRADRVAMFLTSKGIQAERIKVVMSYGETLPMVETEETSRENRRVMVETVNHSGLT